MCYVLRTMYYVLCTMYYVLCTMYFVLCTMYIESSSPSLQAHAQEKAPIVTRTTYTLSCIDDGFLSMISDDNETRDVSTSE